MQFTSFFCDGSNIFYSMSFPGKQSTKITLEVVGLIGKKDVANNS